MLLNTHTYYSYKYGTMSIEELLDLAMENGHDRLALTDINSTSAWVDFIRSAEKRGICPAVGIDFRNGKGVLQNAPADRHDSGYGRSLYIGIALNAEGRHELNRFLSEHLMEKKAFPERAPEWEHVMVIHPFANAKGWLGLFAKSPNDDHSEECPPDHHLTGLHSNEFIGLAPEDIHRFRLSPMAKDPALKGRVVMLPTVTFRHKRDFNLHRLLRAMDKNVLLSKLPKGEEGKSTDRMPDREELLEMYAELPEVVEATERLMERVCTTEVLEEISDSGSLISDSGAKPRDQRSGIRNPSSLNLKCYSGSKAEDEHLLRALCEAGLPYRYPMADAEVHARVEKELDIIIKQGFVSYFLINWDIVNYARKKSYFYVGRGSGANSVVAYLMRITDVDPIELDLYFERFINLFRSTPPDFDMDFSWADREDITRYIFERFPTATLLGAYSTFQFRAARRELGKVFGLPAEEIETIGGAIRGGHFRPKWEKVDRVDRVDKVKEDVESGEDSGAHLSTSQLINSEAKPTLSLNHKGRLNEALPQVSTDQLKSLILRYASYLIDKPSHLSIHSCGILIPDKPITYYTSTFMPPKGFPTAQISMLEAEDIGINKFDILSQRGLGKIKDCLAIIQENHPDDPRIDIHDINRFKQDERVKEMLRNGDAIGCFYVESPAMRMLMRKLEVDDYLGLVAASSVIRPGVAQSGMMKEYILRKRHPEKRKEAHPVMLDIMPETFGVMVYQEDVIKVAHYFAGLTLGEADVLRRGMSGKYRSREEFQQVKDKFFSNCINDKGYTEELTAEIWRQTESFAGYAFAKGHSASYAVESYQSLFLKAYYPIEYMVATINNGGGFYTREHYIHEARMQGAIIEAPCIQESTDLSRVDGKVVHLGLHLVKGLDQVVIDRIIEARGPLPHRALRLRSGSYEGGLHTPFESLADLLDRVPMGMEQLSILIHVGALRAIGNSKFEIRDYKAIAKIDPSVTQAGNLESQISNFQSSPAQKKELLWQAYAILEKKTRRPTDQMRMFRPPTKEYALPELDHQSVEDAFDEMEYLGFPLCHPFDLLREPVDDRVRFKNLHEHIGERVTVYGYLVTAKNTTTIKGDRMNFGNFVDRDGEFLDTVHFPQVAARYPFRGKGVYEVVGKVTNEFDFQTIEVETMERLPYVDDVRYSEEYIEQNTSDTVEPSPDRLQERENDKVVLQNARTARNIQGSRKWDKEKARALSESKRREGRSWYSRNMGVSSPQSPPKEGRPVVDG